MTSLAWTLLAAAVVLAAGDWYAVSRTNKTLEYVCKPATLVALIGVAMAVHPKSDAVRWSFVVALLLSLAGDIFLMLPRDAFVPGLASFFGAHVAYIVGFRLHESSPRLLLFGAAAVFAFAATIGRTVIAAVRAKEHELVVPVSAYIGVISVMVACAIGTRESLAATGAVVFMISDSLIAWNRFVRPLAFAPVAIMVTYHVAQALLVLSLRF